MPQTTTLRDVPNWRYMLQECDALEHYLPAGGSDKTKTHQRKAREAIARLIKNNAEVRLQPRTGAAGPCVAGRSCGFARSENGVHPPEEIARKRRFKASSKSRLRPRVAFGGAASDPPP